MNNYMNQYCSLYRELGLLSNKEKEQPMHLACANRVACWAEAQNRIPPDNGVMSWISQPWVGSRYQELGLAAIGVNLNEYGGLNALTELTEEAKELISDGYRRVRFHDTCEAYPGSLLWHRLGSYSAAIAEAYDTMKVEWSEDGYPLPQYASQAFDMISFIEHIKCSPIGDKSKPTTAMWERCGCHILKSELAILQPSILLVLGKSDNAWYLSKYVFDSKMIDATQQGLVTSGIGSIANNTFQIFIVPHPTSYGGASNAILEDLKTALHRTSGCTADWLQRRRASASR